MTIIQLWDLEQIATILGCNPGNFSFILHDTIPTAVNLQCWNVQCGAKCTLCDSFQPTTAHVLGGCPVALTQGRFTYCHDQVLHCLSRGLSTDLSKLSTDVNMVSVYADLPGL